MALLGPRQSGKTTLARLYAEGHPCEFFDLESLGGLDRLQEPSAVAGDFGADHAEVSGHPARHVSAAAVAAVV